jgi:hypothetical protein
MAGFKNIKKEIKELKDMAKNNPYPNPSNFGVNNSLNDGNLDFLNPPLNKDISWQAPDFYQLKKTTVWYITFIFLLLLISTCSYIITKKDYITTLSILTAGIILLIYSFRKSRKTNYKLEVGGYLQIDNARYSLDQFSSFSRIDHPDMTTFSLDHIKNFSIPISIVVPDTMFEEVYTFLSQVLPEKENRNLIDIISQKINF